MQKNSQLDTINWHVCSKKIKQNIMREHVGVHVMKNGIGGNKANICGFCGKDSCKNRRMARPLRYRANVHTRSSGLRPLSFPLEITAPTTWSYAQYAKDQFGPTTSLSIIVSVIPNMKIFQSLWQMRRGRKCSQRNCETWFVLPCPIRFVRCK